ncbi:CRISPR-associated endonuclease Cas3'' [Infirmifilum lucidum]|uniref:CRISPR-associated endonuclease Cas3 n=1 Tax=Infirmifilum lucidum TaxID=2776706 RepID=A0A7L9FJ54_9CREN|nr:CRISPR-associated endonuclease Cas3'' [Infirmifilum lucidum]QOJ78825.1 CRISPR-associated endonuclease Cas3'' [Infirmifilum lucidum]
MECAAYFKDGQPVQSMREHVLGGLGYIERNYLSRNYGAYLSRLARAAGLGADEALARRALVASYVLHDAGKLLEYFQRRRKDFRGHEFFSAAIVVRCCGLEGLERAAAIAVLLHHHTMQRDVGYRGSNIRMREECAAELERILEEHAGIRAVLPRELSVQEVKRVSEDLLSIKYDDWPLVRVVYAILEPLTLADHYAARLRGGEGTLLGGEAERVERAIASLRLSFSATGLSRP